jgi:Methylamine utilisation protein MauE
MIGGRARETGTGQVSGATPAHRAHGSTQVPISPCSTEDGLMSLALDVSLACRVLLGAVFFVSLVSKIRSRAAWRSYRSWLNGMPLRPLRGKAAPAALAAAEFVVVAGVASPLAAVGLGAGAALSLALAAGLYISLRRGAWQPCHCFGSSSEPLSGQHIARNAVLFVLAITGLLVTAVGGSSSPSGFEAGLAVIGGLAGAVLIVFFGDIAALGGRANAGTAFPGVARASGGQGH